jgi:hypothetical protein
MKISDHIRMARFARLWPPAGAQKCPTLGGEVGRVKALSTDYPWTADSSPQRHLEAFKVSTEGKILSMWTTGKARKWARGVGGGLILVRVGGWGGGGVNPYKGWKGSRSPCTSFIHQTADLTGSVRLLEARGRGRPSHQIRAGEGFYLLYTQASLMLIFT